MIEKIKNVDLVITPNHIKEEILKEISKKKELIKTKFISVKQFKQEYFEKIDEKSLYALMKEFNLKYEIAKEYLENIHLNYDNQKQYYNYLKEKNLIKKPRPIKSKKILVIGYPFIEPYVKEKLDNLNAKYIKIDSKEYKPEVLKFDSQTDEIVFLATKIVEDLENVDINNINIIVPTQDYYSELYRVFNLFNIPLEKKENSIYSTKTAQDFLKKIKETNSKEEALENLSQNEIYNKIIDILNKYSFIKEVDNVFIEIIESEIKRTKIGHVKRENEIKIIDIDEISNPDKYYYIIGLNQNILPQIYKNDKIIDDKNRKLLGLYTSIEKTKNEKEKLKNIITSYKNIYLSYKLKDNFGEFYPSSIIDELDLEVKIKKPLLKYSNNYNKLLLSELLDNYINYNEKDERIYKLYANYRDLDYKTYDNTYQNIDNERLKQYLNNKLTISYSSMNNYFLCPFKFYIQNILKLNKTEETFPITVGNLYHKILENIYKESFNPEEIYYEYLNEKSFTNKEKYYLKKIFKKIKEEIEIIKNQDTKTDFKEKITEQEIVINKDKNLKVEFKGIIDKINIKDNYITIIDYKTGNIKTSLDNIDDGINLQLPVYIYLIKKGFGKDKKIVGFYLQKLLNSDNNLKLEGYTINDEEIIEKIDHTYENSEIIKGMKKTKNGFYAYTKLITEKDLEAIEKIVDGNVEKVIKAVENSSFEIRPKKLKDELISCKYCKFKDLCYHTGEETKELKYKTFKEIVGDENA